MGTGGSRNGGFDDERWLPIKFGPVSNGEFHPLPHSPFVREVIRRTHRLADDNARRLGISRREFLTGVTGAAATLFVLGACSKEEAAERGESPGGTLDVSEDATTDTRAALEDLGGEEPNSNVYAELGGTWWFVMRDPTVAAHTLGKLLTYVGEDRVVWGTDSIWFGTPQDQIQALRTFQISEELQERHGYPALTDELKAKIFGLSSAALYGIEPITGRCGLSPEDVEAIRANLPPAPTYGPTTDAESAAMIAAHQAGQLA